MTTDQTNFHSESAFKQISKLEEKVQGFTYVPLSKLSEAEKTVLPVLGRKSKEQLVVPEELRSIIQVEVTDRYEEDMKLYKEAVAEKIGARTQSRMEWFTVYRLRGVPKSTTMGILFLENLLLSVMTALPSAKFDFKIYTKILTNTCTGYKKEYTMYKDSEIFREVLGMNPEKKGFQWKN